MAKSRILKELANNEITLDVALKRLLIICNDLGYNDVYKWAEKELDGYSKDDSLPEYRNLGVGHIYYDGLKGNAYSHIKYNNQPLPLNWIPKDLEDYVFNNYERNTIMSIVSRASSKEIFSSDLTSIAPMIKVGIYFTSITQRFDSFAYEEIVNRVSNILFKIYMKLDSEYGNLDELDIDISSKETSEKMKIEEQLVMMIGEVKFINIGNDNVIKNSDIGDNN